MTPETETGFGTGLRAQLARLNATPEEPEAAPVVVEEDESLAAIIELAAESEPAPEEPAEVASLRQELEGALVRERELREALEHHVEAHERELEAGRDLALKEAELDQASARLEAARSELEEQKLLVTIQREQLEAERTEVVSLRTEVVAEQARLDELAVQSDLRTAELVSDERERAQASAHLAQQLASIAERERELKREREKLQELRSEHETQVASRSRSIEGDVERVARKEREVEERELALRAEANERARERKELEKRVEELASREESLESRLEAREKMLENGQARLNEWEARLRDQSERLERERTGHGQASQDAFALLAELEQREQQVAEREAHLLAAAETLAGRNEELTKEKEAQRRREAGLVAELELREDKLERRERDVAEREELINHRERELGAYVGELQGQFSERRDVA